MNIFADSVVSAVLAHMNTDHPEDNLLIVHAFGHPDATAATMTNLDGFGGTWHFSGPQPEPAGDVMVPWTEPIAERSEIRREIVVLYEQACIKLGVGSRNQ